MRRVRRIAEPESLRQHAERWTRELLQEIENAESEGRRVPDRFYTKYNNHSDVKESLARMYQGLCCYCEQRIAGTAKGQVEHRKPKRGDYGSPELTYEWENLHWACPVCNRNKDRKWDPSAEILDAAVDRIPNHLDYALTDAGVLRNPLSKRGETTRLHTDLDRDDLIAIRVRVLLLVLNTLKKINQSPEISSVWRDELVRKENGEFGSLVTWARKTWPPR